MKSLADDSADERLNGTLEDVRVGRWVPARIDKPNSFLFSEILLKRLLRARMGARMSVGVLQSGHWPLRDVMVLMKSFSDMTQPHVSMTASEQGCMWDCSKSGEWGTCLGAFTGK